MHFKKLLLSITLSMITLSAQHNLRIINGSTVEESNPKWNFIASLQENNIASCGATIISPNWAITASHCVIGEDGLQISDNSSIYLAINDYSLSGKNIKRYGIEKVISYPDYNPTTTDNDIALLKLSKTEIEINKFPELKKTPLTTGTEAFVAGWGNTIGYPSDEQSFPDKLQEILVPIVDWEQCNYAFDGELTDNMFCAGYFEGGKDSCQGDSGGPLITYQNGQASLIGVVSWGDKCAEPEKAGIYTNVQNYIDWIVSNTGELRTTATSSKDITKLYVATFNRAPDSKGIRYWVSSNLSLNSIASSFFEQSETKALYPEDKSVKEFIQAVYKNLFNREPADDGVNYWNNEITQGSISKSLFILAVINGAKGDDITILNNKQSVGEYFANKELNNVTDAFSVISNIDATSNSVTEAISLIDNMK